MVKHFQDDPNPPPFIKALAEVRRLATREGWCFQHVQAITVAIDQYAAKAYGNCEYFLNKPQSIGGTSTITFPEATVMNRDCRIFLIGFMVRDGHTDRTKNARRGPPSAASIFFIDLSNTQPARK